MSRIERGLALNTDPDICHENRSEIRTIDNRTKRLTALMLHEMTSRRMTRRVAAAITGFPLDKPDLECVGVGSSFMVFRQETETGVRALKVHHRSLAMRQADQRAIADTIDAQYRTLSYHLPDFILPQVVTVTDRPHSHRRAVMARADFVADFTDVPIFSHTESSGIDEAALAATRSQWPDMTKL